MRVRTRGFDGANALTRRHVPDATKRRSGGSKARCKMQKDDCSSNIFSVADIDRPLVFVIFLGQQLKSAFLINPDLQMRA